MTVRATHRRRKRGAAKPLSQAADRTRDRQSAFVALKKSLRLKPATGYRVGTMTEADKYDNDA
jgi:hypothetical protein